MSDSQDAKNAQRARQRAQALIDNATPDKVWAFDEVKQIVNAGLQLPAGTRITAPTTMADFYAMDLGSGASPIETMGLQDYLNQNGLTLPQYQQQFGALPFVFNPDGTATYDPSAQRVAFEHTPASYARNQMIGMALFAAMAGAGLAGVGQGAGTAASGVGSGATNAFGGMDALLGGAGTEAGSFASSFAPTITEGTVAAAGAVPGAVAPGASLADMAATLGSGGVVSSGTIPGVAGLSNAAVTGILSGAPLTVGGPLGDITLPAQMAQSGVNPVASQAAKTVAEKTLGNSLTDAAGKVVTNLATGAITNAIAGDGGKTSSAGLDQARADINAAAGKLPTEDEAASQAHADVTQAFQTQRDNFRRQLMGYGLDPTSGRYQGTMRKLQGQEAKTDALGQNLARRGVRSAALGEAATIANINAGLTNAQAVLDANNFARQQAVQAQVRAGLAPVVSAVAPGVSKTVSNWFDLAKNGISDWSNSFDTSLVGP